MGGPTTSELELVKCCEKVSETDLGRLGFRKQIPLCFQLTKGTSSSKSKVWPLTTGVLGSSPECKKLHMSGSEGIRPAHCSITWDSTTDDYFISTVRDAETYYVMNSGVDTRDSVRLHLGDEIVFRLSDLPSKKDSVFGISNSSELVMKVTSLTTGSSTENEAASPSKLGTKTQLKQTRRTFTVKRDEESETPMNKSLLFQKIKDLDIKSIENGFKSANAKYKRDTDSSYGALMQPDDEILSSQSVSFIPIVKKGLSIKPLKWNMLGGASAVEDVLSLESHICDEQMSVEVLEGIRSEAVLSGIAIEGLTSDSQRKLNTGHRQTLANTVYAIELTVVAGPQEMIGQTFDYGSGTITIGSHSSNTVHHKNLAPFHAVIQLDHNFDFWVRHQANDSNATYLKLIGDRQFAILKNDSFRIGKVEIIVVPLIEGNTLMNSIWKDIAVLTRKTRSSFRYRHLQGEDLYSTNCFLMGGHDEMMIGRKVHECDVTVQDYEMPAYAAIINRADGNFYVSSMTESKKKSLYLEISDRTQTTHTFDRKPLTKYGKMHQLEVGTGIRFGRNTFEVIAVKRQTDKEFNEHIAEIADLIRDMEIFSNLPKSDIQNLASVGMKCQFKADDIVIRQGKAGSGLFLVLSGNLNVFHDSQPSVIINKLSQGMAFGEISVLSGLVSMASVIAVNDVECLFIDSSQLKTSIKKYSFECLRLLANERLTAARVFQLQEISFMEKLPKDKLQALSAAMYQVVKTPGQQLFAKGENHNIMYLISNGKVVIDTTGSLESIVGRFQEKDTKKDGELLLPQVIPDNNPAFKTPYGAFAITNTILWALKLTDYLAVLKKGSGEIELETKQRMEEITKILQAPVDEEDDMHSDNGSCSSEHSIRRAGSSKIAPSPPIEEEGKLLLRNHTNNRIHRNRYSSSIGEGEEAAALDFDDDDDASSVATDTTDDTITDLDEHSDLLLPTDLEKSLIGVGMKKMQESLNDIPYYIYLKGVSGPHRKKVLLLTGNLSIFGRRKSLTDNHHGENSALRFVSLNDRTVSREHCMIQYRNNNFYVFDRESKHGTHIRIDGDKDCKLKIGDTLSCSQHEFVIYGKVDIKPHQSISSCCSLQ